MMQSVAKFFIDPVLFVWIGLLFLFLKTKKNKKSVFLVNVIFFFISISAVTGLFPLFWKLQDTYNPDTRYDAVVILTGISQPGHYKAPGSENDFRFNSQVNRLLAAIEFVRSGHAKQLLFGNWIINDFQEGPLIRRFSLLQGLKKEQIEMYGPISRTLDEVAGITEYGKKKKINKLLLVTSESHMRRAVAMFKKQNITPDTYAVNKSNYRLSFSSFIPSLRGLSLLHRFLYEGVGYVGYFLRGDL